MKKAWPVFLLFACLIASAQTADLPPYQKQPVLPVFSIQQTDKTMLSTKELPAYAYYTIIYFIPGCSHCQALAKDIISHKDSLKNMLFFWITPNTLAELKQFGETYGLASLPNMRLGREPGFTIMSFFEVRQTPFAAVYDAKRKLVQDFPVQGRMVATAGKLIAATGKKSPK
jgi:thioredoxin-related protein